MDGTFVTHLQCVAQMMLPVMLRARANGLVLRRIRTVFRVARVSPSLFASLKLATDQL